MILEKIEKKKEENKIDETMFMKIRDPLEVAFEQYRESLH